MSCRAVDEMEHFIEVVKRFPILWNPEVKDYRDLNKKDIVWKRIVEETNIPDVPDVKTAKNEWKKLRDSHRESLKRMKASSSGQAAASVTNNWKYAGLLEFLLPYMKNRKRTGRSTTENENILPCTSTENQRDGNARIIRSQSDEIKSTSELSIPPRQKKRRGLDDSLPELLQEDDADFTQRCEQRDERRAEEAGKAKKNVHPLNLFFDSMCESTKRLPDWIQRDVKKKLLNIVCEAEETCENYLSRQQYQYGYTSSSAHSTPLPQEDTHLR